ncbi:RNA polymerase sigma factor SigJ [Phytoactinopolyspora halotolerans]|uniref:RNA polymerase sigma-70 factor n=1 Tax=Phytoactinopolyspora halotolerans TaxID=1981512 RepID=A0A6L9S8C2_9ACTN|nr:RNA polymerase sigma factor SigJ [Phytoactinopolyspora halotolerans]NEE00951.1 RNA polymerase sigma-70 factor [Phytoactinopolyspora halotolerans]
MSDDVFSQHRATLIGVAYRILGSLADAEDVVQDAWLRWHSAMRRQVDVEDHRAYLIQIVTRLALDHLRSARVRRENYVGPWLPEPVQGQVTGGAVRDAVDADPAHEAERRDTASFGLLVVLETLSPLERAVFVLREAFDLPFADIATILDRSEEAVRQLARRSRAHVAERRARYDADPARHRTVIEQFMTATTSGDVAELLRLLAPDVTITVDTDGKVRGIPQPVHTADKVARFLGGAATRIPEGMVVTYETINGMPGAIAWSDGKPITVMSVELADGKVAEVYWIANPDKLARLAQTTPDSRSARTSTSS